MTDAVNPSVRRLDRSHLLALALKLRLRLTRERYAEIQAERASRRGDIPTS